MCSSSQGDQPFNITWLKDDVPIQSSSDSDGTSGNGRTIKKSSDPSLFINEYAPFSSILSIHNVSSRHNGNYSCRIANRAGSVEYTAVLSVAGNVKYTNFNCFIIMFIWSTISTYCFVFCTAQKKQQH